MEQLRAVLEDARAFGFLGPGPIEGHVEHAQGFAAAAGDPPTRCADLGSGGGLPGLVLASVWPSTVFVLVDSNERRTAFLQVAVDRLGVADRVVVVRGRAEVVGHDPAHRGAYDLVVARGFGPPPVVAECAAPLLRVGGVLVTSEPPGEVERWDDEGLARLGLVADGSIATPYRYHRCRLVEVCSPTYPRRVGVPSRRPLWKVG